MAQRCPVGALRLDRRMRPCTRCNRRLKPGPCLRQLFRRACRVPEVQEEVPARQLPPPRPEADHTRPGPWAHLLAKLGWMRLRLSRKVLGELRNATVSLSGLRLCERGQPHDTGEVRLRRLRLRGQRRCRRRDQYFGAGTPRCSLWRGGAAGPSNPPKRLCAESSMRSTVGISALQAGEDVQCPPFSRLSSDATSAAASSDADRHDGLNAAAQA